MDGTVKALSEIGFFAVTVRGLDDYEKYIHIDRQQIPDGAVVVDVGSGWNQELSRDLEKLNRGIATISLDASLAMPVEGIVGIPFQTVVDGELVDVTKEMAEERIKTNRKNSYAAIMPDMPLKDDVANMVVDCYGPATYLDDDTFVQYVDEVNRVLKSNGTANIYPIDNIDDYKSSEDVDRAVISAKRRIDLLDSNLVFETFIQKDYDGVERVGITISKS